MIYCRQFPFSLDKLLLSSYWMNLQWSFPCQRNHQIRRQFSRLKYPPSFGRNHDHIRLHYHIWISHDSHLQMCPYRTFGVVFFLIFCNSGTDSGRFSSSTKPPSNVSSSVTFSSKYSFLPSSYCRYSISDFGYL